jgi:hypothetical protein
MEFLNKRRDFITPIAGALSVFLCVSAVAQEGYHSAGHDNWHQDFYSKIPCVARNPGSSFPHDASLPPASQAQRGDS